MTAKRSKPKPLQYPSLSERAEFYDLEGAAKQGLLLPRVSMLALEDALLVNELDLITRARVLGYYSKKTVRENEQKQKTPDRLKHILWLIENVPDCTFAGNVYLAVDKQLHPKAFKTIKEAWQQQISKYPQGAQIKINAAMFAFEHEPRFCKQLLHQVLRDNPDNLWAPRLLAKLDGKRHKLTLKRLDTRPENFDREAWRAHADELHLETLAFHGAHMPPISAKTLEEVISLDVRDLSARAELIGYYSRRWKRANVLGINPESLDRLLMHYLFCIEWIAGSQFVGRGCGFSQLNTTFSRQEQAFLVSAWNQNLSECPKDPAILACAAAFFSNCGNQQRATELIQRCRKHARKDRGVAQTLKYGVQKPNRKRRKNKITESMQGALDEISMDTQSSKNISIPGEYTFQEWASEQDLGAAHLEGCYNWVSLYSIANRDVLMSEDSLDVFNRAKIIGSRNYAGPHGSKDPNAGSKSRQRHMTWFIRNLPELRFLCAFNDPGVKEELLKAADANSKDPNALVNIAAAFTWSDRKEMRRLTEIVSQQSPVWGKRLQVLLGSKPPVVDADTELSARDFVSGKKNLTHSRMARMLDLHRQSMYGWRMPPRTIWSCERAVERNPNDMVLRAELLAGHSHFDRWHIHFGGFTPDVVPQLVSHNLWFIQHLPDYYLYGLGCDLSLSYSAKRKFLAHHAILLEAAKRQMKAYPRNLAIGLALIHYYPLGWEAEALEALRQLKKLYPNDAHLKRRIAHMRMLRDARP